MTLTTTNIAWQRCRMTITANNVAWRNSRMTLRASPVINRRPSSDFAGNRTHPELIEHLNQKSRH